MRPLGLLLERLAADEVVVELHEGAVPQLVRRHIVVLDAVRNEAAADRTRALVTVRRQPLAVFLHLLAGVHGRKRRRDPARLEGIARIRARADLDEVEFPAGLENGVADLVALGVRTPHHQAWRAGHTVSERAHLAARDVDHADVEELDIRGGVRPLDLESVVAPDHGLAARVRGRAVVADVVDFEAACLDLELDPVHGRRAADEQQLVLVQVEHDPVADHVAIVTAGHHLLGLVRREVGEAVDRAIRHQLERIGPLDGDLRHVVRLVEQHGRLAPCALLVAPIAELAGHDRVDVGSNARVAQQPDRVAGRLKQLLQTALTHGSRASWCGQWGRGIGPARSAAGPAAGSLFAVQAWRPTTRTGTNSHRKSPR